MGNNVNHCSNKTNEQLIAEINKLQKRISKLEIIESKHKNAESLLQNAVDYSQSIVETVREPLIILDANLKVISANRSFYQNFHVVKSETEGHYLYDIGNKQWDIPELRKNIFDIIPKKTIIEGFEVEHDFPVLGPRIMLLNAREIVSHQNKKNILLAIEDITARRNAEHALRKAMNEIESWNKELEVKVSEKTEELINSQNQLIQAEKLSAMGQMAGGLVHEMNSPLAGLIPMIKRHLEKADKKSDEFEEFTLMLKAADHMSKIIKDFGIFTRRSKGEYKVLNLNEVIEDTLSFSLVSLKQKGIKVRKELSDQLLLVRGEKTELQQVILNMLSNAKDAVPAGGILIIKTDNSGEQDKAVMEFIDNGIGIDKENIDHIFDPFFTTKKEGEGTGLGLSVTHGIIVKHGGEIIVESEPDKGTRFAISLPAAKKT